MFKEVAGNLGSFLLLFVILMIAFADAFNSISRQMGLKNTNVHDYSSDDQELHKASNWLHSMYSQALLYSFFMALGEFSTGDYSDPETEESIRTLAWVVFFICTFAQFILIVNLLIAAVETMHSNAIEKSTISAYQQKAQIIYDI